MHNCSKHTFRTSHKYVLANIGLFDKIFQEILISTALSKIVELFQYAVFISAVAMLVKVTAKIFVKSFARSVATAMAIYFSASVYVFPDPAEAL